MQRMPDPRLPGAYVTTPIYIGQTQQISVQETCTHQWPEYVPALGTLTNGSRVGSETCLRCGAVRAVYLPKKE